MEMIRATALRWSGRRQFLFAGAYFSVALVRFSSAQAPPAAGARDSPRRLAVRIGHIPTHNEGDGDLFAPLRQGEGACLM